MTRILSRPYDQHAADRLTLSGFLPPIARALAARGIQVPSDLEQEWAGMLPPAMLEGTREAAERLALARDRHEAVTIVADYDCDGATACAVGIRGLRMLGITANYFVPSMRRRLRAHAQRHRYCCCQNPQAESHRHG